MSVAMLFYSCKRYSLSDVNSKRLELGFVDVEYIEIVNGVVGVVAHAVEGVVHQEVCLFVVVERLQHLHRRREVLR